MWGTLFESGNLHTARASLQYSVRKQGLHEQEQCANYVLTQVPAGPVGVLQRRWLPTCTAAVNDCIPVVTGGPVDKVTLQKYTKV